MGDYKNLTKDELGKKLDDAKKEIQDLKVEKIKANSDRIKKEKAKEDPSNLNLAQKLAKAMDDMGALAKDGSNNSQGWTFISESAIKAAIRRVAGKYGFAIIPTKINKIDKYERKTSRGGTLYFYDVIQDFIVTDGKEQYEMQMIGTGSDSGDKAVNKAVTVAFKNLEKQLFNVSDQNDPDPDSETNEATVPAEESQPTQPRKPGRPNNGTKNVKRTIDWSKPKNISNSDLKNHLVRYPNGTFVNVGTILAHVRKGNADAKKFADNLKGHDAIAYVELDRRTMIADAVNKIKEEKKQEA
ncbi:ERF family protein [Lactobacillus amylovorus]|uniref:ERF family protein n=1 Tax=Lactobacillus amylovorus TaxID=1604 RepID=UPI000E555A8F|nr:ERF family protein [Lactobacillus amylovorus]RGW85209.1 hypothetical protein DWV49_04740 [Lactobacillus amylovorus]